MTILRATFVQRQRTVFITGSEAGITKDDILNAIPQGDRNEVEKWVNEDLCIVDYALHGWLFPLCSVVIHHGGSGTVARAVISGVPQIVIPILAFYDQPVS